MKETTKSALVPTLDTTSPGAREATSTLLRRLYRSYIRHHLRRLAAAGAVMAAVGAMTALNAWLLKPVVDDIFLRGDSEMLILLPIALFVITLAKGGATYGQAYLMAAVGQRIIAAVQSDLFAHLMRADLAYFHRETTGKLVANFLSDAQLLQEAMGRALTGMAKDAFTVLFLLGVLFYQDWRLALATSILMPVAVVPIRNLGKRMRKASTRTQLATGRFSMLLGETLQGVRHVKAYAMENYESARAQAAIDERLMEMFKVVHTRALAVPVVEALAAVAIAGVVWYGGSRVISGATTPGTFFSFIAALIMAYQPIRSLASLNAALQEGLAAASRIFAHLDVEPAIKERPDAKSLTATGGEIEFNRVSFVYANGKTALRDITFTVPAGKTVALVGPSGAGKSTVINLIPRFYDVDSGRVTIDGTDVREATLASLRGAIGLVSQEATLFNDTVQANIGYGRPGASEGDIRSAARDAAAHDFIVGLPQGYDTLVGENGVMLSGGQRQRIAIARAMLKNAPILLLDEATSALDAQSERQVQTALEILMHGRTTLVVAHRLGTIQDADRIHVIDDGRVVESGRHGELLARGGLYAQLYAEQTSDSPTRAVAAG